MPFSSVSTPAADSTTLLICQRSTVITVLDMLDELAVLVPPPECLPGWQGTAKDAFSVFLNDVATELLAARASLQGALSDLDAAISEESNV